MNICIVPNFQRLHIAPKYFLYTRVVGGSGGWGRIGWL